jgi:menaquinone-dependent protoporphyrinogen IX oxidase
VTKGGVTAEYAAAIAAVLRGECGLEVDVVNLGERPTVDSSPYAHVVVGTGVRMQRVYGEAVRFLEQKIFTGKKVAVFVTSVEPRDTAIRKYVRRILRRCPHLQPVAIDAFGGHLQFFGRAGVDHRDLTRVRAWARGLGAEFGR